MPRDKSNGNRPQQRQVDLGGRGQRRKNEYLRSQERAQMRVHLSGMRRGTDCKAGEDLRASLRAC